MDKPNDATDAEWTAAQVVVTTLLSWAYGDDADRMLNY